MIINLEKFDDKYSKCPVCDSNISEVHREQPHCNGDWNEYVKYNCGHKLHYSPNFRHIETIQHCSNSKEEFERRKSMLSFYDKVINVARKIECLDSEYKNFLLHSLGHYHPKYHR